MIACNCRSKNILQRMKCFKWKTPIAVRTGRPLIEDFRLSIRVLSLLWLDSRTITPDYVVCGYNTGLYIHGEVPSSSSIDQVDVPISDCVSCHTVIIKRFIGASECARTVLYLMLTFWSLSYMTFVIYAIRPCPYPSPMGLDKWGIYATR